MSKLKERKVFTDQKRFDVVHGTLIVDMYHGFIETLGPTQLNYL